MVQRDFSEWNEEAKAAWAAGIIDGEGAIGIAKAPWRVQVQVGQAVKGSVLLEVLKKHFGARLTRGYQKKGPNRQLIRHCFWTGDAAGLFLKTIRPYLLFKGPQADLALRFLSLRGANARWATGQVLAAEELYRQCRYLNRKGKAENEAQAPVTTPERTLFDGLEELP
jgi:hypothetical protein